MMSDATVITTIDDPRYVKAFAHPLRVRIFALLQERRASPAQLAARLGARLGTVAYHVRTLHQLGLIELVEESRVRGAVAHHYRAKARPQISGEAWGEASPIGKEAAVSLALQTIEEHARASAAAGGFDRGDAHITRTGVRLDPQGWEEAAQACHRLLDDLRRIQDSATGRIDRDPHAEGIADVAVVLLLFEAVRLSDQLPSLGRRDGRRQRARGAAAS